MSDLISRKAAIDYFVINVGFHDEDGYPIDDSDELRKIWTEYFDGIPPAQPEIVKCEDCKYHISHCCYERNHIRIGTFVDNDDYCSHAEKRKAGEANV